MKPLHEPDPAVQRVRVGMTGLAIVLLLIGLAGAIFRWVGHERPAAVAQPALIANLAQSNAAGPGGEPLAEIGVAPSGRDNAADPARPRR